MDSSSQPLFLVHITDGYTFRNTIGIIKSEIDHATMILSPKMIEISFLNAAKCAAHKMILNTAELTVYRYNVKDEFGNLLPEAPYAFDTNEMFNTTKSIGRRDGIRLYCLPGDNRIHIQPMKSSKDPGKAKALFVPILNKEHSRYDSENIYPLEPNVRVQAKDFADLCAEASTLKCGHLEIIGNSNGVTFKGILPNNKMASINTFKSQTHTDVPMNSNPNNMDEIDSLLSNLKLNGTANTASSVTLNIVKKDDLLTVKVPISTVKSLSKIHNISQTGTLLRFFFLEGRPTKIESPIGTYGNYTIYLRNGRT